MSFSVAPLADFEQKPIKNTLSIGQKKEYTSQPSSLQVNSQSQIPTTKKSSTYQDIRPNQSHLRKVDKQKVTPMKARDPNKQYLMQIYSQIIETVDVLSEKCLFSYMVAQPEALCLKNKDTNFEDLKSWVKILSKRFGVEITYISSLEGSNIETGKYVLYHLSAQKDTLIRFDAQKSFKNSVYRLLWLVTGPSDDSSVYLYDESNNSNEEPKSNDYYFFYAFDHMKFRD